MEPIQPLPPTKEAEPTPPKPKEIIVESARKLKIRKFLHQNWVISLMMILSVAALFLDDISKVAFPPVLCQNVNFLHPLAFF